MLSGLKLFARIPHQVQPFLFCYLWFLQTFVAHLLWEWRRGSKEKALPYSVCSVSILTMLGLVMGETRQRIRHKEITLNPENCCVAKAFFKNVLFKKIIQSNSTTEIQRIQEILFCKINKNKESDPVALFRIKWWNFNLVSNPRNSEWEFLLNLWLSMFDGFGSISNEGLHPERCLGTCLFPDSCVDLYLWPGFQLCWSHGFQTDPADGQHIGNSVLSTYLN